ncbi:MAG: DUF4199 domain-containing protein [Mucilaginibacter sp.]
MKNALTFGIVIGILSGAWLFLMRSLGHSGTETEVAPIEYVSIIIPLIGLYFGIRSYRATDCGGQMGFLEALIQSFKILLAGGVIAIFGFILYISYVTPGNILRDFSGRMFGALLVGVIFAFGVSLLLANKSNKVD